MLGSRIGGCGWSCRCCTSRVLCNLLAETVWVINCAFGSSRLLAGSDGASAFAVGPLVIRVARGAGVAYAVLHRVLTRVPLPLLAGVIGGGDLKVLTNTKEPSEL